MGAMRGSMRRGPAAAAVSVAVALGAGLAHADPPPAPRVDGVLRLVATGLLRPSEMPPASARVPVSVRMKGGAATLNSLGFTARAAAPDTAYLEVTPAELVAIREAPGVVAIERARTLHPTLDDSVPATGATAARAAFAAGGGGVLDGRGVLVGVVDTGLDFRHADFRDANGGTRVHALLDLATERGALHPELPDYARGAVWLAADLDAQLAADAGGPAPASPVVEKDTNGHGTHVAGIAAGNGRATGQGLAAGRYVGMAPGAGLVAARASRVGASFAEEDLLTSVRFLLDRAAAEGRPAAINLSLGGDGGPHDGTLNLERGLSDLFPPDAPGRALVVSAGNAGARDLHAGGLALPDGPVEIRIPFPAEAPRTTVLSVELWFDGPPPSIALVDPDGRSHGPVASGQRFDDGAGGPAGHILVDNGASGADPVNHRREATVYVAGTAGKPPAGGTWKLVLDGSRGAGARAGRWDAWLVDTDATRSEPRFLDLLDADSRADFPAFAAGAITAGSFVSRNGWPTVDGRQITRGTIPGRPSAFSGTGPTLDGRFLPDVVAPGDFILSSMSVDAPAKDAGSVFHSAADANFYVADDGMHGALRGTSQAAPHVTGAIALLFQIDPTLSPGRLRELLRASAAVEPGAPGWSTRLGFGRLDVARAVALLRRAPGASQAAVDAAISSVGVSRDAVLPGASRVRVSVVPRDATGLPLGPGRAVTISADAGRFDGPVIDAGEGRYERTLVADGPRGTACTVTASVDDVVLADRPVVWFVLDRTEVGRPFTAGGGCGLDGHAPRAPRPSSRWILAAGLALAAALLHLQRRRRPDRSAGPRT